MTLYSIPLDVKSSESLLLSTETSSSLSLLVFFTFPKAYFVDLCIIFSLNKDMCMMARLYEKNYVISSYLCNKITKREKGTIGSIITSTFPIFTEALRHLQVTAYADLLIDASYQVLYHLSNLSIFKIYTFIRNQVCICRLNVL